MIDTIKSTHEPRTKRIAELDGLRAFAVIGVIIGHFTIYACANPKLPHWLYVIIGSVAMNAVNVFFVISGFIITTLLLQENENTRTVSLSAFYVRRFFRIIPPFAVYLIVLLLLRAFDWILLPKQTLLYSAFFLGDAGLLGGSGWFVGHTWSLSLEEQYYLVFPLLFAVLKFKVRATSIALCVLFVTCLLFHKLSVDNPSPGPRATWDHLASFRFIIVGVMLALRGGTVLKFLTGKSPLLPMFLALLVTFGYKFELPVLAAINSLMNSILVPIACGLFTMWFVQNPQRCALLRHPVVQWVGACSYSIYLWQQLFTGPAHYYQGWRLAPSPLTFVAILLCASVSYYAIERPSIRLGKSLSSRFTSAVPRERA